MFEIFLLTEVWTASSTPKECRADIGNSTVFRIQLQGMSKQQSN